MVDRHVLVLRDTFGTQHPSREADYESGPEVHPDQLFFEF
jgi:hypothetical protein